MKNFMVFQERSIKMDYRIYQLDDEKKFYCSLTEKNMGFSVQKTIDYANNFDFFDTLEDAQMFINERVSGMVEQSQADVFCPMCNRGYEASDMSEMETVWVYTKTCACGHKFKVEGRQIILYAVIS